MTSVEASELTEDDLFRAVAGSGARVLLIGRKAMVLLGLPVATYDYDFWVHFDDVEKLNAALVAHDHVPNHGPDEARARGRYVVENGEHIDVMVARAKTTARGETLTFDDAWARRRELRVAGVSVAMPSLHDLIRTKEWAMRAKDIGDIQLLEALRREQGGAP